MNEQMKFPAGTAFGSIGHPIRRKEDARLLTGKGRFTDDFSVERQTYAAMVRSPHPHARIVRIDSATAKAMPGVLGVFTGADCLADGIKPIPHTPVPATKFDMKLTARDGGPVFAGPHMLLPADKARHVGEAVAMVVAETRAQAMDAAEAVEVEYEELPFVIHSEDALKPGAPMVWNEIPDNVPCDTTFGDKAKTDRAFAEAAHVVKTEFNIVRVTGVPMELRSCLAEFDAASRQIHALRRLRRRGAPEDRTRQRARHRARQAPRSLLRRRRQFRHAQPAVRRVRPGAVGRGQAQAPGQIHRDALGGFSHRLPRPRSRHQGRTGVRQRAAVSWRCAPTTSAMPARAASRCRRCRRARA